LDGETARRRDRDRDRCRDGVWHRRASLDPALGLLTRRRRFCRPLDIGTGSGVLAIAAAKLLRRPVLASDVDPEAARVAAHHVRRNGLAGRVRVLCAAGYRARPVGRGRYDLVLANILARPLALMARDLAPVLAPGGIAVLAGLLARQEGMVVAAHRAQGLALVRRLNILGWSTLILRKAAAPPIYSGGCQR